VYQLEERVAHLQNQIINQRHQFKLEKENILNDHRIALDEVRTQTRFDYEAKLGTQEMLMLNQIDEMSEKLSKAYRGKNAQEINEQLLTQM
jgi:hypothetical protein